jgi:VWFA-related protein
MRTLAGLTVAVVIALVATTPLASRQFRAGTALVLVDVVATQADGNLNRDLKREDFLIFEDGKPQEVKQFQVVDLETIAAEATDPPGVFSNRAEPGAVFALVLDDMNVDAKHTALMQQTARKFVDEQVRVGDYIGVMRTGVNSPLLLTTDREMVRPQIAQTMGRRDINDVSSLTGAAGDTLPTQTLNTAQMPDFGALGLFDQSPSARIQAEQSLVMLQRVVEYLAPIPARRKAVLLFSQGIAFDLEAFAADSNSRSFDTMSRLLAAAREGNVAVYTVDPRGLQGSTDPSIGEKPVPVTRDAGLDTLRDLATATGGRAVVSTNEIPDAFNRISRENRFYYLIGYEPSDTAAAKTRARQIEVKTRAPGTTLLHRRAYAPSAAIAVAAIANRAPITSPLPVPDLAITMAPVVFPDPSGGASLAVPFEVGGNLPGNDTVKYTLVAIDGRGVQAGRLTGTVRVSDGSARGMVRQKLAPGRYQLRLQAEIDGRSTGVALANVLMIEPNAEAPVCGGFMLLQPEGGTPRPNVTRFFHVNQPVMAAVVLSARTLANTTLALVARRPGAPEAELPLGRPQKVANGLWRVESGIPPSTFNGDVELVLLANEQPVPGCRTELSFE